MDFFEFVRGFGKDIGVGVAKKKQESLRKGAKRTIKLAAITAGDFVQYTPNHEKLRGVIGTYGYFNTFTVMNNDSVEVQIELDYDENKTYPIPSSSSITVDEVEFLGFNVRNNDSSTATTDNKITIVIGYEPPLIRERRVM